MDKMLKINSIFNVKSFNEKDDTIEIEGYANTTTKDRMGDIILAEAWTKGGLDNYLKNPIILAYHNHSKPIGTMLDYSINDKGLNIVAEISKAAGDIYDLVKSGILKTFSVGFRVKDADYDEATELFVIKDLELYEISVVSVPANADSVFSIRKCLEDETEYDVFKKEFINMPTETKPEVKESTEVVNTPAVDTDTIVKNLEAAIDSKLEKITDDLGAAIELALEPKEKEIMPEVKVETGTEKLLKDIEDRMSNQEKSFNDVLDGLRTELKEKSEEITAMQRSKMFFNDERGPAITDKEIDEAIFVAKTVGKSLDQTSLGKKLIEKSGAQHVPGSADASDWEKEFSTRIFNDVREKLIVEPLFSTVNMTTYAMQIPINPEAGTATWITTGNFRGANSTGTAVDHAVTDTTLTAYKLAAKEYIGYEEEEDAIIPIVPIIRDAVVRRMARSSDIALLRGDLGQTAGGSDVYPFNGIATIAADAGGVQQTSIAVANKITVANLQTVRRGLGVRGINPGEVTYVVSQDVYYDLLEDDDFRTMDLVGDRATILTGQVGFVNGSPVIISGEFEAKAATKHAAVAVYKPNFVVGALRGMMIERDRDIEQQKNILVATRRVGFLPLISGAGASVLTWTS